MSFIMKKSAVRKKALTPAEALLWAFAAALLAAFVVWPVGSVFAESFMKNGQFSLRAYEGLFTKNVRLVLDSFTLALSVAALSVPVSAAVALRLVYGPSRGRSVIVAALALSCELLKIDRKDVRVYTEKLKAGIALFRGGKRRSEVLGRKTVSGNDVIFIDDYAHHPTAIKTTLAGYREFYQGRKIIVDFMSHTYTRTAALLEEFAASFENADEVILHKIYASARENAAAASVTGKTLFDEVKKRHGNVQYFEEWKDAKDFVLAELGSSNDFPNGILFVTMGAGDNWQLGKAVYEEVTA